MNDLNAHKNAILLANKHYENFPVASFLIPKEIRQDVAIIYWFARTADDFADEGSFSEEERLKKLTDFKYEFEYALLGKSSSDYFKILANTITSKKLSQNHFYDLLSAFEQDVIKKRYSDFNEVLDYCDRSANPVGRIILELNQITHQKAFYYSDKICTALQITNFLQDSKIDFEKGRIYYPLDEMKKYNVDEKSFELNQINPNLQKLVGFSLQRTQDIFEEGKNILNYLNGRLKFEINWTILGGEKILNKIRKNDFDILAKRPKLNKIDFSFLLVKSFIG